jgi:hypothetical protein
MNRDKHISVKGNFGIFLIKSKENYVFVLVAVGSTHIFVLGEYSIYSILATQIEEKIVREGGWRHSQRKQNTHGLLYYSEKYVPWKIQYNCL